MEEEEAVVEEVVAAPMVSELENARMIIPQGEKVLEWNAGSGTGCSPLMSGKMFFLWEQQSPSVKHKKGERTGFIPWERSLVIN